MSDYDKGMMDGWHGDEYDVEFTWEELDEIECQKADEQNDENWLDSYQIINNALSNPNTNPPNCSDIGVYSGLGVEHE